MLTDESKPSILEPKPGSLCVVQYEEDNGWYRGQIVKYCDHQGATVLFVDYGNTQLAPVEKIKSIDEEFVKLPSFAYHCKLDGVDASRDWKVEEKDKFQSRTMGKIFSATFTLRDSDGKYPVRLVEEMKKAKIAIKDNLGAPSFPNILPPRAGYSSRSVSFKPISVLVSYFVNPFRFFLSSPVICAFQVNSFIFQIYFTMRTIKIYCTFFLYFIVRTNWRNLKSSIHRFPPMICSRISPV